MKCSIRVHIDAAAILAARGLGESRDASRILAETAARLAEPYTPRDTGALAAPTVTEDAILYGAAYARYQYGGVSKTGKALAYQNDTGLRGAQWMERMAAAERDSLLAAVAERTGGRIR